jgi:hypothetical protein
VLTPETVNAAGADATGVDAGNPAVNEPWEMAGAAEKEEVDPTVLPPAATVPSLTRSSGGRGRAVGGAGFANLSKDRFAVVKSVAGAALKVLLPLLLLLMLMLLVVLPMLPLMLLMLPLLMLLPTMSPLILLLLPPPVVLTLPVLLLLVVVPMLPLPVSLLLVPLLALLVLPVLLLVVVLLLLLLPSACPPAGAVGRSSLGFAGGDLGFAMTAVRKVAETMPELLFEEEDTTMVFAP